MTVVFSHSVKKIDIIGLVETWGVSLNDLIILLKDI